MKRASDTTRRSNGLEILFQLLDLFDNTLVCDANDTLVCDATVNAYIVKVIKPCELVHLQKCIFR